MCASAIRVQVGDQIEQLLEEGEGSVQAEQLFGDVGGCQPGASCSRSSSRAWATAATTNLISCACPVGATLDGTHVLTAPCVRGLYASLVPAGAAAGQEPGPPQRLMMLLSGRSLPG